MELTWEANHYSFHAFNASLLLPFFPLLLTDNFNIEIVNSLGHGAFSAGLSSHHLQFQWNARKDNPDPETSNTYLCIPGLLGGIRLSITTIPCSCFAFVAPLPCSAFRKCCCTWCAPRYRGGDRAGVLRSAE